MAELYANDNKNLTVTTQSNNLKSKDNNMKRTIFLLLLTVFSVSGQAQKRQPSVAGYGAAVAELTSIDKKAALNLGGYGGVLINHRFLLGASGNNILFSKTINGSKTDFQFNYYGLITEYKFFPGSFVHFSAGLTSALGWLENDILTADKKKRMDGDYVYVIQPRLALELRITSFMQGKLYGNYRFTGNTKSRYFTPRNLDGAGAGAALVFGSF